MFSILGHEVKFPKPTCFVGLRKGEWHTSPASVYWGNLRRTEGGTADQAGSREAESPGPEGPRPVHPSGRYSRWVLSLLLRDCRSWGAGLSLNEVTAWSPHTCDERLYRVLKSHFCFEFFHRCNMKKSCVVFCVCTLYKPKSICNDI